MFELAAQSVQLGDLIERGAECRLSGRLGQTLARQPRFVERIGPAAPERNDLGTMHQALAAIRHHVGLRVAPAAQCLRPLAGASDVDPTTVATIAVIGATTVFALSWLTVLVFPVLAVILVISSRVGVVTGQDLQTLVRSRFGRSAQLLFLGSILVVTILTLAADLEAGAAAAGLLLHMSWRPLVAPVGIVVLAILLLGTFDELQKVLKYVVLVLLAYVASALAAPVD